MKTFETPIVDVKKFDVMDVLTASTTGGDDDEEEEDPGMLFSGSNCIG